MRRPALALAFLIAASASAAHAVDLIAGDLIVAGPNPAGGLTATPLLHINTATGDRTVVSGCVDVEPCTVIRGGGPVWEYPGIGQVGISSGGQILVLSTQGNTSPLTRVFSVDPETGDHPVQALANKERKRLRCRCAAGADKAVGASSGGWSGDRYVGEILERCGYGYREAQQR